MNDPIPCLEAVLSLSHIRWSVQTWYELPLGPQAAIWILSNSEVAYIIHSFFFHSCTLYFLITKTNWQGQSLSIGS